MPWRRSTKERGYNILLAKVVHVSILQRAGSHAEEPTQVRHHTQRPDCARCGYFYTSWQLFPVPSVRSNHGDLVSACGIVCHAPHGELGSAELGKLFWLLRKCITIECCDMRPQASTSLDQKTSAAHRSGKSRSHQADDRMRVTATDPGSKLSLLKR
jgi:hypothetical protein